MITRVAMVVNGVVHSLERPKRHHHIISMLFDGKHTVKGEQGFLDEEWNFLTREQAAEKALSSGQIEKLKWPPKLYSEDLW